MNDEMHRVEFLYVSGGREFWITSARELDRIRLACSAAWGMTRRSNPRPPRCVSVVDRWGNASTVNLRHVAHVRDLGLAERDDSPPAGWRPQFAEDARPGFWRRFGWF